MSSALYSLSSNPYKLQLYNNYYTPIQNLCRSQREAIKDIIQLSYKAGREDARNEYKISKNKKAKKAKDSDDDDDY